MEDLEQVVLRMDEAMRLGNVFFTNFDSSENRVIYLGSFLNIFFTQNSKI